MPLVGEAYNPWGLFKAVHIPDVILLADFLSHGSKLCFGVLMRFGGPNAECFPSQDTIARYLRVSERQARDYIQELEANGFLQSTKRGQGKTSTYEFLWHPTLEESCKQDRKNGSGLERNECSVTDRKNGSATFKEEEIHLRESVNTPPPAGGSGDEEQDILLWIDQQCIQATGKGFHTTSPRSKRGLREQDSPGLRSQILHILKDAPPGRNVTSLITGLVSGSQRAAAPRRAPPQQFYNRPRQDYSQPYDRPKQPSRRDLALAAVERVVLKPKGTR